MIFEQIATGGCQSYLVGCADTCAAALIDPELSQIDRYLALAARDGLRIRYVIDTHTHADHFSATRQLARQLGVPVVMHRASPAPFVDMRVDDGEMVAVGKLRLQVLHTPGHTADSMCLLVEDRLFTGDTLLIGGTGRTDLPTGDPDALLRQPVRSRAEARPGAAGLSRRTTTRAARLRRSAQEIATNPRLQKRERAAFVAMMQQPRPVDADPPHRGAAHQHERRQDRRAAARRSRRERAVHVAGRAQGARRFGRRTT